MNILFAASEMVPFCKTGGLADVIGALPPVLAGMGHEVAVMIPGYEVIDRDRYGFAPRADTVGIPVGAQRKLLRISAADWKGVRIFLLDNNDYFGRKGLYSGRAGDYPDNAARFVFFARGVLEAAILLGICPDIIHSHDWQAALVNTYLATVYAGARCFVNAATLFTIHNLGYQGLFPREDFMLTGFPPEEFHWTKLEYYDRVSFIKGGIVYADAVSTVSETYAEEITMEPLGFGLHGALDSRRENLYGIVNGIDEDLWNPALDRTLPATFGPNDMGSKAACRAALLGRCGFEAQASVPVVGMVSRLDVQKGFDILEDAMGRIMAMDIALVILGAGAREHQAALRSLARRYKKRLHVTIGFDNDLAKLIYAGSDAFLMPSRYEPCGLGQLIAMKYGTLPVVHATGGLADTVRDLDEHPGDGTGFAFADYSPETLVEAIGRAVALFRAGGRKRWNAAVRRAMTGDYSWNASAQRYMSLYEQIGNQKRS